jgi:hypothetical protein
MSRIRLPIDWRSWSRSPRERPVPPRLSLLGYDECRIRGPLQESWMSFAILVRANYVLECVPLGRQPGPPVAQF